MEQVWFEMPEIRRRTLTGAVWIPLRCIHHTAETGRIGEAGYGSEFYGAGSVALPLAQKEEAQRVLGWSEIGISHNHAGVVQDGHYLLSDHFEDRGLTGVHLVLDQRGNKLDPSVWHLHQDLVTTLGLKREGDQWVRPEEGYAVIARLTLNDDASPRLLEIRASHLRDYVCARGMALYVTSYRDRTAVLEDSTHITWPANPFCIAEGQDRWEGRVTEIAEGGMPYGSSTGVFHAGRTDVDPQEDVPTFGFPQDESVQSRQWTVRHEGKKLFRVEGELWRNEWIDPVDKSPIVRGDRPEPTISFVVDAAGKQENASTLVSASRWLWFRPEVMPALAHRRGGSLSWYTRDTGNVECSPGYGVHFGVNSIGLVNVYAKDIALLPEWQQRIWAGYNVAPDGKVSEELLASQMRAEPAPTKAPEAFLPTGLTLLNKIAEEKIGTKILRAHDDVPKLIQRTHRFRATDQAGLYVLAKDLARLTADSFDAAAIQQIVKPPAGVKWGSLKSVENLVAQALGKEKAAEMMGPLFRIYDLRLADAHLPSRAADDTLAQLGVNAEDPFVLQGFHILHQCVGTLFGIIGVLERWQDQAPPSSR